MTDFTNLLFEIFGCSARACIEMESYVHKPAFFLLLLLNFVAAFVFYFLLAPNRSTFNQRKHWAGAMLCSACLSTVVAWRFAHSTIEDEGMVGISISDFIEFLMAAFVWSLVIFFLWSLLLKRFNPSKQHLPTSYF
jgi:hypothetical protein